MEMYQRIIKIIEIFADNSQTRLAKRLSVPQSTFHDYLNPVGQSKIRKSLLDALHAAYPQVSRDWLYFGEGDMLATPSVPQSPAPDAPQSSGVPYYAAPAPESSPIPLIGLASCGVEGWSGKMCLTVVAKPPTIGPGMIAVMAYGESMLPEGIGHGMTVYCDLHSPPVAGEPVYVEHKDGLATMKRYLGRGEEGGKPCIRLQGWYDKAGDAPQKPYQLWVHEGDVTCLAPVEFIRRRI